VVLSRTLDSAFFFSPFAQTTKYTALSLRLVTRVLGLGRHGLKHRRPTPAKEWAADAATAKRRQAVAGPVPDEAHSISWGREESS
jgi:hypothetical protein